MSFKHFGSTTLSYSRKVSSAGTRVPASDMKERSTPPAQRAWTLFADVVILAGHDVPAHKKESRDRFTEEIQLTPSAEYFSPKMRSSVRLENLEPAVVASFGLVSHIAPICKRSQNSEPVVACSLRVPFQLSPPEF